MANLHPTTEEILDNLRLLVEHQAKMIEDVDADLTNLETDYDNHLKEANFWSYFFVGWTLILTVGVVFAVLKP